MSKFKKGDRVLLLLTGGEDEGTVEDVIPGHPRQFLFDRFGVRFRSGTKFYYQAHDLELVPKFDFKVGDKLTTPNWSCTPERFVTVEWIGPYQFAGETHDGKKVVHDFASVNSRWQKWVRTCHFPFKVGDRLRQVRNGKPTDVWQSVVVLSVGEPTDRCFHAEGGHRLSKFMGGAYTWELVPEHEVSAPGTSGAHDAATSTSCEPEPGPVHPFKVGDKVRCTVRDDCDWPATVTRIDFSGGQPVFDCTISPEWTWTHRGVEYWEHYVEPEPGPVPTVKKWLVITEERAPLEGETFVYATEVTEPYDTGFYRAECDFTAKPGNRRDVATSVRPLTNLNDWIVGGDGK